METAARKLQAGDRLPALSIPKLGEEEIQLAQPKGENDWQLALVYRGKHCPICTRYLGELNEILVDLNTLGIDVVAVFADTEDKARAQIDQVKPGFDVGYGLTVEQMQALGLYISHPRSPEETDCPFAEPGLFIVNGEGRLQVVDISNTPFARPNLKSLLMGLGFIRNPENNYPIRGTLPMTDGTLGDTAS